MYIVAIAWLYVVVLMAFTAETVMRGVLTFLGFGAIPLALLLWLLGAPHRRRLRERASMVVGEHPDTPDQHHSQRDQ